MFFDNPLEVKEVIEILMNMDVSFENGNINRDYVHFTITKFDENWRNLAKRNANGVLRLEH